MPHQSLLREGRCRHPSRSRTNWACSRRWALLPPASFAEGAEVTIAASKTASCGCLGALATSPQLQVMIPPNALTLSLPRMLPLPEELGERTTAPTWSSPARQRVVPILYMHARAAASLLELAVSRGVAAIAVDAAHASAQYCNWLPIPAPLTVVELLQAALQNTRP